MTMPDRFDPYRKWLGIPCEEQPPHHYRLLGIPLFEADLDVIENAAHRQMVYVRTLQAGKHADLSQKLLNELAAAKVCLMSRQKKAAYDQELQARLSAAAPATERVYAHATQVGVATVSAVATSFEPNHREPAPATGADDTPADKGAASGSAITLQVSTSTHDHARARHTPRQRMLLVPLLFGVLGVIAVVVIVTLLALNFKRVQNQAGGPAANGPASWLPALGYDDKASQGARNEGLGTAPTAGDSRGHSPREERIYQQLPTVRAALAARDLSKAKTLLQGLGTPTRDLALRSEKERLELVHRFLTDFWATVPRGLGRVKSRLERRETDQPDRPVEFEYFGVTIEVTRQGEDKVQLKLDGQPWDRPWTDLPPKPAAALAVLGLDENDGFGRFYVAAFLLMDGQGDPAENRTIGEAYYRLAERMVGQPNFLLADEFQLGTTPADADASPVPPEMLRVRPKSR